MQTDEPTPNALPNLDVSGSCAECGFRDKMRISLPSASPSQETFNDLREDAEKELQKRHFRANGCTIRLDIT